MKSEIIENIFLPLTAQLQHLLQNVRGQAPARFVISAATLGTMRGAKGEKACLIKRTGTVLSMPLYKSSPALAGLPRFRNKRGLVYSRSFPMPPGTRDCEAFRRSKKAQWNSGVLPLVAWAFSGWWGFMAL
ncbi:hypothetical protein M5X00_13165 [Paenibacillus alvei]|uniref:hypothetical protein n=1 Tax=Paenibacillus alvei TaxID=44250 RepID=UPI000592CB5C|nr:hypothetical protein [Paenibacillus alvei]MCY9708269.1 hypothetical protein [Paenibacillus alvei]MCY9755190.1 hypothetical protein [Paenibacillus alvei]